MKPFRECTRAEIIIACILAIPFAPLFWWWDDVMGDYREVYERGKYETEEARANRALWNAWLERKATHLKVDKKSGKVKK